MKYLLITLTLVIVGCDMSMPGEDITKAIELCEANGGIEKLTTKISGANLVCKNGAKFVVMYGK